MEAQNSSRNLWLSKPRSRQAETDALASNLEAARRRSLQLAAPLTAEDMTVQAMDDASPTKWHLAHTTWFFERFVLEPHLRDYRTFDDRFNYCFNSYYECEGPRHPRPKRGLLTRPPVEQIFAYRNHVDEALGRLLESGASPDVRRLIETGVNHEQQHQELMLTDILALFAASPLRPAYDATAPGPEPEPVEPLGWIEIPGGIYTVGSDGETFAWDNETPRHELLIHPHHLADRLTTNGEWLEFMGDSGYATPSLWLSDGWTWVNRENRRAPLYWELTDGQWRAMSLAGLRPVDPSAPVSHVSYYEADAFARWAGKRLPTEFEWEVAAAGLQTAGGKDAPRPRQMFGAVWQWTQSAYAPYPGYRAPEGALGEYNGKFMVGQQTLRGSSHATPPGHSRATYRNFFYPGQCWQFTGLRLACEAP